MSKKFGATGDFPEGKIDDSDEGALQMGISDDGTNVILNFGTPVMWVGMPPDKAVELANMLIERANKIKH